ncbi:hypothetical protein GGH13_006494 [Coemansia sp. S155-1]|nr:hypothetical protein H4S03_000954 [Coemansia sp. S3946]KAJ2062132.1 hypothetical protein GGH13_006494 [Coemansia sp. S155-1]
MPYSISTASPSPPFPVRYSATPDVDNFYAPTPSQPSKMDINVNLMLTVDYAGEKDKTVYTELSQSNSAPGSRIVYERLESSSGSYSSTTTTTITVYPTLVPTSPKGYTPSLDSATARRNHYHHHGRASVETYLLPNDEASAISNAMHFKNKVEHISEFLEPTHVVTIEEEYLVATVDN